MSFIVSRILGMRDLSLEMSTPIKKCGAEVTSNQFHRAVAMASSSSDLTETTASEAQESDSEEDVVDIGAQQSFTPPALTGPPLQSWGQVFSPSSAPPIQTQYQLDRAAGVRQHAEDAALRHSESDVPSFDSDAFVEGKVESTTSDSSGEEMAPSSESKENQPIPARYQYKHIPVSTC